MTKKSGVTHVSSTEAHLSARGAENVDAVAADLKARRVTPTSTEALADLELYISNGADPGAHHLSLESAQALAAALEDANQTLARVRDELGEMCSCQFRGDVCKACSVAAALLDNPAPAETPYDRLEAKVEAIAEHHRNEGESDVR